MSVSLYGSGQSVIQFVQGTYTTQTSFTGTTPASTGLTATITPLSSSSKIYISISSSVLANGATSGGLALAIYRNGSAIYTDPNGRDAINGPTATAAVAARICLNYLDSPATTSATTYTVYAYASAAASGSQFGNDASLSTITLMEISQA